MKQLRLCFVAFLFFYRCRLLLNIPLLNLLTPLNSFLPTSLSTLRGGELFENFFVQK